MLTDVYLIVFVIIKSLMVGFFFFTLKTLKMSSRLFRLIIGFKLVEANEISLMNGACILIKKQNTFIYNKSTRVN